eukprot:327791-Rhodomonas_salina.1
MRRVAFCASPLSTACSSSPPLRSASSLAACQVGGCSLKWGKRTENRHGVRGHRAAVSSFLHCSQGNKSFLMAALGCCSRVRLSL